MIDLGTVKPGSTIRIPFSTYKGSDGAAITMTNYATADILIYKDGSTTERASTSGFTATTDFDSKTGKQLLVIDLADNTTADFYASGSEYLVAIDSVTIDTATTGGWVARFKIGYQGAYHDTTIASLASQTSFTLTAGSADNSGIMPGSVCIVHKANSAVQIAVGVVSAYTGATKTVTLAADPAVYTMAAKDNVSFFFPANAKWIGHTSQTGRDIGASVLLSSGTGTGQVKLSSGYVAPNWGDVGNPTATVGLSGTTVKTATDVETDTADIQSRLPAALSGGKMDSLVDKTGYALTGDYDAAKTAASQTSVDDVPTNAEFEARTLVAANYGTAANQTTLLDRLTSSRAGYLDNLNVGGAVASNADIVAINQSASRRILLTTVGQYERPESGSTVYTVEARTFDGDGAATNADSSPTLTGTGQTTGSLAANIGSITNPATGVYRWTYTVASSATVEPIRFDISATMTTAFTLSVYTQVVDFVSATWTASDASKLTAVYDKLPSANYITGTASSDGSGYATPTNITSATGITVVTNNDKTGYALTSAYDPAKTASQAGDAMTLTSGERTTLAAAVWNALTSGMATVGSIGKKLADVVFDWNTTTPPTAAAVASQVRTELTTELGRIDENVSAAKMLTSVYDAAKTAASQSSVNAIPTNPMLATEDGTSFTAIPDMATATNQAAIAGYIDTEVAAILSGLTSGIVVLHADYNAAKTAASQSTADADHDTTQAAIAALAFATSTDVTNAQSAIIAEIDANEAKIDQIISTGSTGPWTTGGGGGGGDATEANQLQILSDIADLQADVDALSVASGTGAHAGVITVDDGTIPVQSARVYARLNGILKAYGVTDVDGEIDAFRLDPGTYDIAILAEGHLSFASDGGLVVGGDDWSDEYSLTSVTPLVPDNPDAGVISVLCVDGAGNTQEGINVYYKLAEEPSGDTGYAYDGDVLSATSDADGIAELTVVRLGVYLVKRGDTKAWRQITADDAATSTTISFVGT